MRNQYAGDLSDFIKFAFLRSVASGDKKLGVAWYYVDKDEKGPDGRHLEWRSDPAWEKLDSELHSTLKNLPERSIAALEALSFWPNGTSFHREPIEVGLDRHAWALRKRSALDEADLVFLDPDNGPGIESEKHATYSEIEKLRRNGRSISFITFPGRNMTHDELVKHLHKRLAIEVGATSAITLRTSVSVPSPRLGKPNLVIPSQRWFTVVDPSEQVISRMIAFSEKLATVARTRTHIDMTS